MSKAETVLQIMIFFARLLPILRTRSLLLPEKIWDY